MHAVSLETPSKQVMLKNAGPCNGPFRALNYPGMFVLLGDCGMHHAGSILSPNKELSRRASGGTTHMVLKSIYDGFRAQRAIIRRFNGTLERPNGELQDIRLCEEEVRTFVRFCLLSHVATHGEEIALRRTVKNIEHLLGPARTPHLTIARPQLHRTLQEVDSLGRKNDMAAAMVGGAAIGHFAARQEDIARISGFFITHREYILFEEIERIHSILDRVEAAMAPLPPKRSTDSATETAARMKHVEYFLRQTNPGAMPALSMLLHRLADELGTIDVLPFRKMAILTASDLRGMADLCPLDDRDRIRARALLIRRAFRWEKAQRFVELNVLMPLSFVLTEVAAIHHAAKRRGESGDRAAQEFSVPRLEHIQQELHRFRKGIEECSEEGFKVGVKDDVTRRTDTALDFAAKGDWTQVLRWLKAASALI
jgi:hypothetical protein